MTAGPPPPLPCIRMHGHGGSPTTSTRPRGLRRGPRRGPLCLPPPHAGTLSLMAATAKPAPPVCQALCRVSPGAPETITAVGGDVMDEAMRTQRGSVSCPRTRSWSARVFTVTPVQVDTPGLPGRRRPSPECHLRPHAPCSPAPQPPSPRHSPAAGGPVPALLLFMPPWAGSGDWAQRPRGCARRDKARTPDRNT